MNTTYRIYVYLGIYVSLSNWFRNNTCKQKEKVSEVSITKYNKEQVKSNTQMLSIPHLTQHFCSTTPYQTPHQTPHQTPELKRKTLTSQNGESESTLYERKKLQDLFLPPSQPCFTTPYNTPNQTPKLKRKALTLQNGTSNQISHKTNNFEKHMIPNSQSTFNTPYQSPHQTPQRKRKAPNPPIEPIEFSNQISHETEERRNLQNGMFPTQPPIIHVFFLPVQSNEASLGQMPFEIPMQYVSNFVLLYNSVLF